jgi:hypothetical protein
MQTKEKLERLAALESRQATEEELDELLAALASTEYVEEFLDDDSPGWANPTPGPLVGRKTYVAAAARRALMAQAPKALLRVAAAYAKLPLEGRREARELLDPDSADMPSWAELEPGERAAIVNDLWCAPRDGPDAAETSQCVARCTWVHETRFAIEAHDDAALGALVLEGTRDARTGRRAQGLVGKVRDIATLRRRIVDELAQAEIAGTALTRVLNELNADEIGSLSRALEQPRSDAHEATLVEVLARHLEELSATTRSKVVAWEARRCASAQNPHVWRDAIARYGPDALARELDPLVREQLASKDERTIILAQGTLEYLAPAMPWALERLVQSLRVPFNRPLRITALRALRAMGPLAAPATEALRDLLTDSDLVVAADAAETLGAIGPAAASATSSLELAAIDRRRRALAAHARLALEKIRGGG